MSQPLWYSQLFENEHGGGVLLALPYEALPEWSGSEDDFEEVADEIDQFLLRPLKRSSALFLSDDDGIHEAHWLRIPGQPGVMLVVWIAWNDPRRPTVPENWKQVAAAWHQHEDPRQAWLESQLAAGNIPWERRLPQQTLASGLLLLLHAEGSPAKARLADSQMGHLGECSSGSAHRAAQHCRGRTRQTVPGAATPASPLPLGRARSRLG